MFEVFPLASGQAQISFLWLSSSHYAPVESHSDPWLHLSMASLVTIIVIDQSDSGGILSF